MEAFDYPLPPEAIAQTPVEPRDAAQLLVDRVPEGGEVEHRRVVDLPQLLRPGDLLVLNETRVLPARLRLRKPSGGVVEVLLLERGALGWDALVRPGRRVPPGTVLEAGRGVQVEVGERLQGGRRRVLLHLRGSGRDAELAALAAVGTVPLPPYITTPLTDPERYQTVYATSPGSAAAPTAGLHLTSQVLSACLANGVEVATVDLAIGLDTFRPVSEPHPDDHVMHTERYRVPAPTMVACRARSTGNGRRVGRVVAVGTTVVRALETAAVTGELEGRTNLYIHGDYRFRVVDVLLTNFHLPRSSLLLLVDAFVGPRWRELYDLALRTGYRFLSFGDAMLVARRPPTAW